MNLYLCDTCNTLATVEATEAGIKLASCACVSCDHSKFSTSPAECTKHANSDNCNERTCDNCNAITKHEWDTFFCPACKELKPYIEGSGDCQTCETCCKCPDDAYDTGKYCYPY